MIFSGKVQGVFFRKTVFDHAEHLPITGYVKNLSDGSVEALFQGEKIEIEKLVSLIKTSCGRAEIDQADIVYQKANKAYSNFQVVYCKD